MAEAFIAGAVRTAIGKRNGSLAGVHPVDLGAHALRGLVDRTGIDPAAVDDVIMGCVSQIGPQTFDIARKCLAVGRTAGERARRHHRPAVRVVPAGGPFRRPGGDVRHPGPRGRGRRGEHEHRHHGVNRHPVLAGGHAGASWGHGWRERYGEQEISQFRGAQLICEQWGIKPPQLEEFALESHQRAVRAVDEGRFEPEIVPLDGFGQDEARAGTRRWRRWPGSRPSARTGRSRPRSPRRSPTEQAPCSSPRRRRWRGTA